MSETSDSGHIELVNLQSDNHEHNRSNTSINLTNNSRTKYLKFGGASVIDVTYGADVLAYDTYTKNKWKILFSNGHFWMRWFIFISTLTLLTLSISYCLNEILETKLNLVTQCYPKTNEQIWQHSYESLKHNNKDDLMTRESQYGQTSDSCWTTKQYEIQSDQLWYSNKHITHIQWKQSQTNNYKFTLFAITAMYSLIIIFYNAITIIMDLVYICKETIHRQSIQYRISTKQKRICICESFFSKYYLRCVGTDTTTWIIKQFITEIVSVSIQFQALLLYNGYHIFDLNNTNNIYIAIKSEYILLLTVIIACNCIIDGFLWLFYALTPKHCKGRLFQSLLFLVDNFAYLFYILFPFIVVLTDKYNQNTHNIGVLLGQLNIDSIIIFLSIFVPLLFLCNQCLFMLINSINELRNKYYYLWKSTQHENVLTLQTTKRKASWIESNNDIKCNKWNRLIILLISLFYITFSTFLLVFVTQYINHSIAYCNSIKQQNYYFLDSTHSTITLTDEHKKTFQRNPELFVWDSCIYKVYPFINDNRFKCQCRVFVIDWNSDIISTTNLRLHFNITQETILNGILTHWYMLQKFKTTGDIDTYHTFRFKPSMFNALHMIAFEWNDKYFHSIENGISKWSNLQYLKLEGNGITKLPNDFYKLNEMRYLIFIETGLVQFDEQICNLTQLLVLEMQREYNIETIPHCISNLKLLNVLFIDSSYELINIPLSVFNLPNIFELSFYNGNITYNNLLSYNLPNNIFINDTYAINKWFDDTFSWNIDAIYWLVFNPICNDTNFMPTKLKSFMDSNYVKCNHLCSDNTQTTLCIPRNIGNGKCDASCNTNQCVYDFGECVQLCFANPYLTNCTWEKFSNEVCDEGCDNEYCTGYYYDSFFTEPILYNELPGIADLNQCENNISFI